MLLFSPHYCTNSPYRKPGFVFSKSQHIKPFSDYGGSGAHVLAIFTRRIEHRTYLDDDPYFNLSKIRST